MFFFSYNYKTCVNVLRNESPTSTFSVFNFASSEGPPGELVVLKLKCIIQIQHLFIMNI